MITKQKRPLFLSCFTPMHGTLITTDIRRYILIKDLINETEAILENERARKFPFLAILKQNTQFTNKTITIPTFSFFLDGNQNCS